MTSALIDHLWQSTLFCAAVWLITLALRANGAAVRHWLWLAASLKFLVPFSALYHVGAMAGLPAPLGAQPTLLAQALEATAPMVSPTRSLVVIAQAPGIGWGALLLTIWAAGAAVLATRWYLAWRAADSMVRAARPVPGSPLETRVTEAAIEPAVARVFRPVVLLPSALLGRLSPEQLAAVLAHESEHIARRDNLTAHLHCLVQTLFWFHPLVWWIGRQMLEEREQACDEAVLDRGHDAQQYAEGILAVCRHCHEHSALGHGSSAAAGNLTQRIRSIIRQAPPVSLGFCKAFALAACTLALAAVPLLAGAFDNATLRRMQLAHDERMLRAAEVSLAPSLRGRGRSFSLRAADRDVLVRHSTLRELVALSHGVAPADVTGGDWLDNSRYDIHIRLHDRVADPEHFDPVALRGVVSQLLVSHFDLRIRVMAPIPR